MWFGVWCLKPPQSPKGEVGVFVMVKNLQPFLKIFEPVEPIELIVRVEYFQPLLLCSTTLQYTCVKYAALRIENAKPRDPSLKPANKK